MAITDWVYGTLADQDDEGTGSWASENSPNNPSTSTARWQSAKNPASSPHLLLTGYDYGLPLGAAVRGVQVEITRRPNASNSIREHTVRLVVGGVVTGNNLAGTGLWPAGDATVMYGGATNLWGAGLTTPQVSSPDFGVAIRVQTETTSVAAHVVRVRTRVHYDIVNVPPEITTPPTVSYGSLTRLGPNNTPATISFTATDADGDPLSYEIHTAATGGGTLVGSGNATSGVAVNHNLAHNAPGLVEGSNTLHLRVHDGTEWSADSAFTVLRDSQPPSVGTISVYPPLVTDGSG